MATRLIRAQLSFKKVNLLEKLTPTNQNFNYIIDGKRPSPVTEIRANRNLPYRDSDDSDWSDSSIVINHDTTEFSDTYRDNYIEKRLTNNQLKFEEKM